MNPAHSEDTLDEILTSIEWESTFGNMTIEKRIQFKQAIDQNYISKDRVIKAIGENEAPTKEFLPEQRGPGEALDADVRNHLRAKIRKELGL